MQSIFRLPWCSDALGADASKPDMMALQKMRQAPAVGIPLLNNLKRKRSDSAVPLDSSLERNLKRKRPFETELHLLPTDTVNLGNHQQWQSPAKAGEEELQRDSQAVLDTVVDIKPETIPTASPSCPEASLSQDVAPSSKMDDGAPLAASNIIASELSPIQQAIEHQFNLEIMMKHRELRLIEQELAKCQVALEQLRRCEVMPYPGFDGMSSALSAGTGPALRAQPGFSQPSAPSPWGVTDGPYSKHYASWLLPDQTFDSMSPSQMFPQDSFATIRGDGRATRNSVGAWAKPAKHRYHRDSISGFSPQIPSHTAAPAPAPRNKGGPLVLKRMSDGQFVKLVCTKCHRSDFSSVQGFLNHCRIAHKIDYKSHEAAAQDCGHVLEDHEAELAATAPPPVGTTVRAPAPKPAPPQPVASKVHHLNHDTIPRPTWKRQRQAYIEALNKQQTAPVATMFTSPSTPLSGFTMVPSASQPFLSAQLARKGMGVNLAAIVAKLSEKIDLGPEPEDVDDNQLSTSPKGTPMTGGSRIVSGGKLGGDRPISRKGFHQAGNRPRPAPLQTPALQDEEVPESPRDHDLSPRTADSNPGMVSDHDDDPNSDPEDNGSVIVPASTVHIHQGCGDAMDIDLEVDDDHDGHAVIIRSRGSMQSDSDMHDSGSPSRSRGKFGRREK
ncbi:hypothetical protein K461DRAFT_295864 [Myriangium duriaei CBS 260.36]|uniref:AHC1-like C2H2 zinc-finger domain-containing protein n=1 Tax=Myriangium duriaei CBS 260.36 TaxID=1168546 RepID=A0A9P4IVW4_9PEZI|nr:hypothetical protein K461DRAFT_295864 [Myriangium duriaei CBS 260.36]